MRLWVGNFAGNSPLGRVTQVSERLKEDLHLFYSIVDMWLLGMFRGDVPRAVIEYSGLNTIVRLVFALFLRVQY